MLPEQRVREMAAESKRAHDVSTDRVRCDGGMCGYFMGQWQVIARENPDLVPYKALYVAEVRA